MVRLMHNTRSFVSNEARHRVTNETKKQATSGEMQLAALLIDGESASDVNDRQLSHSETLAQSGPYLARGIICRGPESGGHG